MKSNEYECMSTDELWELYEQVQLDLVQRIEAEKAELEERLRKLGFGQHGKPPPYTAVHPNTRTPITRRKSGLAGADNLGG
jgi:hypothetical protein